MFCRLFSARPLGVLTCFISLLITSSALGADPIVPPHVRSQTAPDWPANAPADRDVDVVVVVTVAADGAVLDAHVDDSVGADYDHAAIAAVKRWQFEPATRNGQPIPARVRALVHFAPATATPAPLPAPTTPPTAPAPGPESKPDPVVPDSASKEAAEDPHGPTEITVAGRARPPTRGASDYSISVGELSLVPHNNASDLLKLAPGILL